MSPGGSCQEASCPVDRSHNLAALPAANANFFPSGLNARAELSAVMPGGTSNTWRRNPVDKSQIPTCQSWERAAIDCSFRAKQTLAIPPESPRRDSIPRLNSRFHN